MPKLLVHIWEALGPFFRTLYNALSTYSFRLSVVLVNTAGKVKAIQHTQVDHKRTTWTEHYPKMLVILAPQTMKYELCLNGLLLSDTLPYPFFHCHVRLPVIRACFAVCLMSHSLCYPQLTASGYSNLASVIAGPNTCGLAIVATMQHENLGSHIHVKWLAPNVYIYIYINWTSNDTDQLKINHFLYLVRCLKVCLT